MLATIDFTELLEDEIGAKFALELQKHIVKSMNSSQSKCGIIIHGQGINYKEQLKGHLFYVAAARELDKGIIQEDFMLVMYSETIHDAFLDVKRNFDRNNYEFIKKIDVFLSEYKDYVGQIDVSELWQ